MPHKTRPDVLPQEAMHLSTATWPGTAKEAISGSEKAVVLREDLREREKSNL